MTAEEDVINDLDSHDRDIYNSTSREELTESDELTPEEEGFMKGYDEAVEEEE